MKNRAWIRPYGSLNDFLRREKTALRQTEFEVNFFGNPAIKDVIENAGFPHPEIGFILVNRQSAGFSFRVSPGDHISIYPHFQNLLPEQYLGKNHSGKPIFIADENLGRLATYLRACGFDTLYSHKMTDREIAQMAASEDRILLTRDIDLLKHKKITRGYWVRSVLASDQLFEILQYFNLQKSLDPFSRCLVCNHQISGVSREKISERLLPMVREFYFEFSICTNCERIYWKGPHYERMLEIIKNAALTAE